MESSSGEYRDFWEFSKHFQRCAKLEQKGPIDLILFEKQGLWTKFKYIQDYELWTIFSVKKDNLSYMPSYFLMRYGYVKYFSNHCSPIIKGL